VSYPLIVGGMVYVTVEDRPTSNDLPGVGQSGAHLVALDGATGRVTWGPVELGDSAGNFGAAAYENGHVFAVNGDGVVRSFVARTGALVWASQLASPVTAPPTALGGLLYVAGSAGKLYGIDETSGAVRWASPITAGENSSPAVSADGVYVTYACGSADALRPGDGSTLWHVGPWDCSGQGGATPVVAGDQLWARVADGGVYDPAKAGSNVVLDTRSGVVERLFSSAAPPAVSGSQAFVVANSDPNAPAVQALDLGSGRANWTYGGPLSLGTNLVASGGSLFGATDTGWIVGLDASTGQEAWRENSGFINQALPDEVRFGQHAALAVGDGLLVVPANGELLAYG
jgi:outer membrane protein assembly factor BamB